jgi:hypothetical protein
VVFGVLFLVLWALLLFVLHSDKCLDLGGSYDRHSLTCRGVAAGFPSFKEFIAQPRILLLSILPSAAMAFILSRLAGRLTRA